MNRPIPTAIRLIEGNRGKRALNPLEPQPRRVMPKMPPNVKANPDAARCWRKHAPMLFDIRVLTEADGIALENLCLSYATMCEAQRQLQTSGLLIKSEGSLSIRQNPLLKIVGEMRDRLDRELAAFGMTASSRSKVQTVGEPKHNSIASAMTRARPVA